MFDPSINKKSKKSDGGSFCTSSPERNSIIEFCQLKNPISEFIEPYGSPYTAAQEHPEGNAGT